MTDRKRESILKQPDEVLRRDRRPSLRESHLSEEFLEARDKARRAHQAYITGMKMPQPMSVEESGCNDREA